MQVNNFTFMSKWTYYLTLYAIEVLNLGPHLMNTRLLDIGSNPKWMLCKACIKGLYTQI
jgi:hypothetical protein